ncbi:MAG: alpha-hydroxy-acid oxidizing protein [Desulfobacteraceae bacterium]|nr:alpha-hydroxy-acid oxidizing protein [Desulfobacteraceae bacterium]
MQEIYTNARNLMKGFCKVCKECDGKACAGEVPGMGGLGTGSSFKANVLALAEFKFNMSLIHDVVNPDTKVKLLGQDFDMPVMAAPIGGVSFNMGGMISEDAYIDSVIHGCAEKGIMGCIGDGVPDFIHETGLKAISDAKGKGIPFIKPWEDKELYQKLEKVEKSGTKFVGIDIDAAGLITLRKMGRPVSPRNADQLSKIIKSFPMKFILKGIMTKKDAMLAVDAGAEAVVVSNHGGRVLDSTPGTSRVLAEIADHVKGKITILVDGGIRSGGDVLKLLALGANGVMIGRPFSIAAVGGLQGGVEKYIDKIKQELEQSMVMTGTSSLSKVEKSILFKA